MNSTNFVRYSKIERAYRNNASVDDLKKILGKGRAKKGIFEGDLKNGELEIGQVSSFLNNILSVDEIFINLVNEFNICRDLLSKIKL